jgi:ABC-type glycerol-3-phosphate transport system permease component
MKKFFLNGFLWILSFFTVIPFFIILILGTYPTAKIGGTLKILPGTYLLENLKTVFRAPYVNYYFNSIYIAVFNVFLALLLAGMCAYALAKYQFRGQKAIITVIIATMGLLAFLGSWNNLMIPMIILNRPAMYTLPVGIRNFGTAYIRDMGAQILAVNLAIFPLLIVFVIFNKNMIRGITDGAIKS